MRCFAIRNRALPLAVCALIGGVWLAGCGDAELTPPPLFPVTGTVTYQGKPVPGATVVFAPEATKRKAKEPPLLRPSAVADDEGNYTLVWSEKHEGAPAAKYKVAITAVEPFGEDDDSERTRPNAIPDKYGNATTSGLTATVTEDGENVFNFDLK
jgi:hypothetical protein